MNIETIEGDDNAFAEQISALLQQDNVNKGHAKNKKATTITVKDGDVFLGGATVYAVWDYVLVDQFFVAQQKQGIGTRVMQEIERWAKANGRTGIYLDTGAWQAEGFYEKMGFSRVGTVPNFSKGMPLYYYAKAL